MPTSARASLSLQKAHDRRLAKWTIKHECLTNYVTVGKQHLRHLIKESVEHYLTGRFHQGIAGELLGNQVASTKNHGTNGEVARRSRLGGRPNDYHREAA